jgi:NhaC family Na+:H+ antiporter
MDVLLALGVSSTFLITTAIRGGWMVYPLLFTLGLFALVHGRRGLSLAKQGQFMWQGAQQSLGVLSILMLIGALIALWMAAGTVSTLVYYGLQWIPPRWFLPSAFGLTGLVSVLLGTSFGAVGTVGLALMLMARSGGADLHWAAGAIIAGAYVGDRCSPMSSSAHLVATMTQTDIYHNLQRMVATAAMPLGMTMGIYGVVSWRAPLQAVTEGWIATIPEMFDIGGMTLVPAISLFVLAAFRVSVKRTMLASLGVAAILAVGVQGYSGWQLLRFLVMGFRVGGTPELADILQGGGLLPMGRVCLVVAVSTALAGLLAGTRTFSLVESLMARWQTERGVFAGTVLVSLLAAAYGCTQTITILLTQQLTYQTYQRAGIAAEQQALDLENSAVVLSPLIPWNIAGLVPATILMTHAGFVPFAVYLYLVPMWHLLMPRQHSRTYPNVSSG